MKKEDFEKVFANAAEDSGVAGIMRAHSDNAELDVMMNMMFEMFNDKGIFIIKCPIKIRSFGDSGNYEITDMYGNAYPYIDGILFDGDDLKIPYR